MEGVGEEGETGREADRRCPRGELGGAGHLQLEVEQGRREGGRQRRRVWFGIRGEGLANHHPVEEEEGVGSHHRAKAAVGAGRPLGQSQLCLLVSVMEPREALYFLAAVVPQRQTSLAGCRRTGW